MPITALRDGVDISCHYGMTRRVWLLWAAAASAALFTTQTVQAIAAGPHTGAPDSVAESISRATLDAAIDTLIPADPLTPPASEMGVGQIIANQAEAEAQFRQWLIEGLKWFDQGVPSSFVLRDASARTELMQTLANSPVGSQTRIFFELLRLRTMTAYYADPRSRVGLAIERPPQPIGYPDFAGRE